MKKLIFGIIFIVMCVNSNFAGQLIINGNNFCYLQDDGTCAIDKWINMDIDSNGIPEYYYFGSEGFLLVDTVTPDGYIVNEIGQMVSKQISTPIIDNKNGIFNPTSLGLTPNSAFTVYSSYDPYKEMQEAKRYNHNDKYNTKICDYGCGCKGCECMMRDGYCDCGYYCDCDYYRDCRFDYDNRYRHCDSDYRYRRYRR